ncbi:MAG: 6-carboxytetrahydropterin synthase [Bryobacterales bacterium]|nr:6-carboxytetrahydropterin synthase [Bryobacterales bacterium]
MLRLARRYRFSASHRLHAPQLSDEQNREVFGKCNNPFGHGHDYVLEVIARGDVDPHTGLLLNVADLDALVRRTVLNDFDLADMNRQIPAFGDVPPTTENVAVEVERRIAQAWTQTFPPSARFDGVRILETKRNHVELRHEK